MDQHEAWNRIGASFDATRQRPWPAVERWLDALPAGRLLDLMAGNGRHGAAAVERGHRVVAVDWSRPLCAAARQRGLPVLRGDARRLPLASGSCDAVLYVAGLHGIPDAEGRHMSLQEVHRVLRPGGRALVTVWSRHAPRFDTVDGDAPADVVVPWNREGEQTPRTYHLYTPASLGAALKKAGFAVAALEEVQVSAARADNLFADVRAA